MERLSAELVFLRFFLAIHCFFVLRLPIQDYSLSQTTLEQVFIDQSKQLTSAEALPEQQQQQLQAPPNGHFVPMETKI